MVEATKIAKVKSELQEVEALLSESLKHDYLSDTVYNQIITKIGHIDEECVRSSHEAGNTTYFSWVKTKLDQLCAVLVSLEKRASITLTSEDLMHPSGDYYNEDNSIHLTPESKRDLEKILMNQYPETR